METVVRGLSLFPGLPIWVMLPALFVLAGFTGSPRLEDLPFIHCAQRAGPVSANKNFIQISTRHWSERNGVQDSAKQSEYHTPGDLKAISSQDDSRIIQAGGKIELDMEGFDFTFGGALIRKGLREWGRAQIPTMKIVDAKLQEDYAFLELGLTKSIDGHFWGASPDLFLQYGGSYSRLFWDHEVTVGLQLTW